MKNLRFALGLVTVLSLWHRTVEAERRAAAVDLAEKTLADREAEKDEAVRSRYIRDASGVLTGVLFGGGLTFGAQAVAMQGTASADEFFALSWAFLGTSMLFWSNIGFGPHRRYMVFAVTAFAAMLWAILRAVGVA